MWKMILLLWISVQFPALFKEPEFVDAQHFTLQSLGMKTSTLAMDLRYYNPNGLSLQLKHAELDVYIEDEYAGHTTLDTLINIPKRDTFSLPVHLEVDMKNVLKNAVAILFQDEVGLRIEGTAKIGKSGIFLNLPINYAGKQKLR